MIISIKNCQYLVDVGNKGGEEGQDDVSISSLGDLVNGGAN